MSYLDFDDPSPPLDLSTVDTPIINNRNEEGLNPIPNFLITHDSPTNHEIRAMIDSGARATVTNLLSILHNVKFYTKSNSCPKHMYGATDKTKMITPLARGYPKYQH